MIYMFSYSLMCVTFVVCSMLNVESDSLFKRIPFCTQLGSFWRHNFHWEVWFNPTIVGLGKLSRSYTCYLYWDSEASKDQQLGNFSKRSPESFDSVLDPVIRCLIAVMGVGVSQMRHWNPSHRSMENWCKGVTPFDCGCVASPALPQMQTLIMA